MLSRLNHLYEIGTVKKAQGRHVAFMLPGYQVTLFQILTMNKIMILTMTFSFFLNIIVFKCILKTDNDQLTDVIISLRELRLQIYCCTSSLPIFFSAERNICVFKIDKEQLTDVIILLKKLRSQIYCCISSLPIFSRKKYF